MPSADIPSPPILKPHLVDLLDLRERAASPNATLPHPFLRWVGSKRYLLSHIVDLLPTAYNTYYEPFMGSAALFFLLHPRVSVLSDSCEELVATFGAVRDNPAGVIDYLRLLKPERELFYEIRAHRSRGRIRRAAEFIYLNKTCWNGLYRVNSAGNFNVPFGSPKSDIFGDPQNIKACAKSLGQPGVSLRTNDFESSLDKCVAGDLVFLDPPYVTSHSNNGFIEYNEVIFSWKDQQRLASVARALAARGVSVIVSNADHSDVIKLYPDFSVKMFERSSTLASDVSKRRRVTEVLIYATGK